MVSSSSSSSTSSKINSRSLVRKLLFGLSDKEIFLIFCVLGATIQIVYILHRFFSYEYLIRSHVGVPDSTIIPDLSICFPIIDTINYTKMWSTYPSLLRSLGYQPNRHGSANTFANTLRTKYSEIELLNLLLGSLHINQLWDHMISASVIFDSAITFKITEDSFIEQPCDNREYFSEQAFCFLFTCSSNSSLSSSKPLVSGTSDMYKKLTAQEIVRVSIYQTFFSSVNNYWVALMPNGQLPRGEKVKWESQQVYNVTRKHTFFFYSITTKLLPSPYSTNCANYTLKGYESKAEMEDKCQINLGIERSGSPLPSNVLDGPIDSPFGLINYANNQFNETFISIVSDIVDYCSHVTEQPDCVKKIYVPSSRTPLPITGNFTEITVEQISDPIFIIDVVPKQTPLDVIIAIGSVLGTWLGFSIAYSIPHVAGILGYRFLHLPKRKSFIPGKPDHLHVNASSGKRSNLFSSSYLSHHRIYGIYNYHHRNGDWSKRPLNQRFPPFYAYYNQQTWPLVYDTKFKPWWYR